MTHQVLLYYWFTTIDDPEEFAYQHRELCEALGLRGRIIIAEEGINGTVSGTREACDSYRAQFPDIEFKVDEVEDHAFQKLFVRVRPEIITLGVETGSVRGEYLEPEEWQKMMREEDVVILDTRNHYESEIGHFENAICPELGSFREFPEWLRANRELFSGKRILTYCTGGIRCEKLTAWMIDDGFEHVFHLHGGIVKYVQNPATQGEGFQGLNVVFDDRVAVPAGARSTQITRCQVCQTLTENYVNCANVKCNARILLCESCESATRRTCSKACLESPFHREKNAKYAAK